MIKKKVKKTQLVPTQINNTVEISNISKLDISFPNEDLNKLVEKINEIINKL